MVGDLQGVAWFYSSGFEVNSFARALLPFRRCLATLLPALPSSFSGKYVVSIMVPLSSVSVTVPGGCRSQGCHGYPTRSAPVLEAPPSFQAPSPSSSIVDEFKYIYMEDYISLLIQQQSLSRGSSLITICIFLQMVE